MKQHPFAGLSAGFAPLFFSATVWCQPQPPAQKEVAPAPPQPSVTVKNFDIFLDPPTGFVFVKLPQGWKFVGKVDESALASLPATVLTSLLPGERDGVVAGDTRQGAQRR